MCCRGFFLALTLNVGRNYKVLQIKHTEALEILIASKQKICSLFHCGLIIFYKKLFTDIFVRVLVNLAKKKTTTIFIKH